ncbi:MAG TPA: glycosyltransferase family 4 protein, partial [Calditrichia bacterium]|nr:glycosyltransferase family 4 protein [Calditrichia bacterium]
KEVIAALDIGVVTSRGSEVICRVAAEYMAMGKPVVVTDVNVLPEMVDDGINGFVVGNSDHQTLARRLELLCFNPEVRLHMGREARRYAEERFSYSTLVEKTLEVYAMLLRRGETLL